MKSDIVYLKWHRRQGLGRGWPSRPNFWTIFTELTTTQASTLIQTEIVAIHLLSFVSDNRIIVLFMCYFVSFQLSHILFKLILKTFIRISINDRDHWLNCEVSFTAIKWNNIELSSGSSRSFKVATFDLNFCHLYSVFSVLI